MSEGKQSRLSAGQRADVWRRWSLSIERLPNLPALRMEKLCKRLGLRQLGKRSKRFPLSTAWTTVEFLASPVRNESRSVPYWNLSTRPLEDAYAAAGAAD